MVWQRDKNTYPSVGLGLVESKIRRQWNDGVQKGDDVAVGARDRHLHL